MKALVLKSKQLLLTFSSLEKNHKLLTYISLLILTTSTYFLRNNSEILKIKFAALKERNRGVKQSMLIFNKNYESFPLPVWQKVKRGEQFILQYVNNAFVEQFGHSFDNDRYNLIGKNNFEAFPKKIAQKYYENDIVVSISGGSVESFPQFVDKNGITQNIKVLKWREIIKNKDTLVYGMVKEVLPLKTNQ
ncbi:hypothetical protein [Polaribacter porphyrae]|uniref:PAS domain-containing protein n=1 Tax=Polaribacter porphyrae TaxID=1137780 RepID=A0A2S7WU09_9FLAO|nr:hypothetical protein [Polaribacter porphyrae]PQJ80802.1 hypothetical protein BTO18_17200 [Polaribacter porphyrae]